MKKVLILGKGYIGNYLYKTLLEKEVTYSKYKGQDIVVHFVSKADMDYTNRTTLLMHLSDNHYNLVINCSGFTGTPNIDECETKRFETYKLNVITPVMVTNLCARFGIKFVHLSSGCIYNGYEKEWSEEDIPNFGIDNPQSSYYSFTKHCAEEHLKMMTNVDIFRLRMPFSADVCNRNYITKLRNYNRLLDATNSRTCVEDLCEFLYEYYFGSKGQRFYLPGQIFNIVNPNPLSTKDYMRILKEFKLDNPNWVIAEEQDLNMAAKRSNCILKSALDATPYELPPEEESLINVCKKIKGIAK